MSKKLLVLFILIIICVGGYFFYKNSFNNILRIDETKKAEEVSEISKTEEKKIESKTDFYEISVRYPSDSLDKEKVIENFVNSQVNQKKEEWKIGGEIYDEEQKIAKDFPDRPKMIYQFFMDYKKYESKKFNTVSYLLNIYEYTGGANGNSAVATFTFDKNGQVALGDVLNLENYKDVALSRLLSEKVLDDPKNDFTDENMINDGLGLSYLKADGETLDKEKCNCDGFLFSSNFQNFILKDAGISFVFSKYQIAPGSSGTPEIMLDWETLKPYLNSKFDLN